MPAIPVIAIFDVGKTNKKLFLFDENYKIVYERSARFPETADEDGDPCENVDILRLSVFDSLSEVFRRKEFDIKAINVSAYGASLVYLDEKGRTIAPLYNYLKEYPETLKRQFYDTYGGEEEFCYRTASPVLGNLNSGMQLYRIKYQKPRLFQQIKHALHLPQYLSFLICGKVCSDITSIGCHTNLWDFLKNDYHFWVMQEGVFDKLAPLLPCDSVAPAIFPGSSYSVGIGLHDSSAALIPYLVNFEAPFILISSGTWCISLNPFNDSPLTKDELENDCLCYMTYQGKPVKASRLFAGYEHEEQIKRLADYYNKPADYFACVEFDPGIIVRCNAKKQNDNYADLSVMKTSIFTNRHLANFATYEEAYHQLIFDIMKQQAISTQLVLRGTEVKQIFVDGGFSKNGIYMHLLAEAFPGIEVFAATISQASALGAALSLHKHWNEKQLPGNLIELIHYQKKSVSNA